MSHQPELGTAADKQTGALDSPLVAQGTPRHLAEPPSGAEKLPFLKHSHHVTCAGWMNRTLERSRGPTTQTWMGC